MSETTAEIEHRMKDSPATITRHWDALLVMPGGSGAGGSRSTLITADDHDPTDADIDRATRIVSLRRFVRDVLNGWSRVVMEDRPVEKALPDGQDVPAMCRFLETHAQWMSGHEAADDCESELADLAQRVKAIAEPRKRDWIYLGDCPFVVEDWFCSGSVRVPIGSDGAEATCSDCGQVGPTIWWEDVLGIRVDVHPVPLPALVPILAQRLHVDVTDRTLRNWVRDGLLSVHSVADGTRLFDPRRACEEVSHMNRSCAVCGRTWSGEGETCSPLCFAVQASAKPGRGEARRHTPAPVSLRPRRVVPDSHDTDRPERCHFSDLPLDQCACGRVNHKESA